MNSGQYISQRVKVGCPSLTWQTTDYCEVLADQSRAIVVYRPIYDAPSAL